MHDANRSAEAGPRARTRSVTDKSPAYDADRDFVNDAVVLLDDSDAAW